MSARSVELRYFLTSNCFSSSNICRPVNVVRAFFFLRSAASASSAEASDAAVEAVGEGDGAVTVVVAAAVGVDPRPGVNGASFAATTMPLGLDVAEDWCWSDGLLRFVEGATPALLLPLLLLDDDLAPLPSAREFWKVN